MSILKSKYLTKEDFVEIYKNNGNALAGETVKQSAFDYIQDNDLPTTKLENWRKTDITPLLKHRFEYGKEVDLDEIVLTMYNLTGQSANILVFVNGHFIPKFSRITEKEDVFIFDNIANVKKNQPEYFQKYFNKTEAHSANIFSALNTAYAPNGAFVAIKKNSVVQNPVHIYHFSDGDNQKVTSLMRNLIVAECGAKAHIVFSFHPLSNDYIYTNVVNEVFTEANSYIDLNIFQGEGDDAFQTNLTKVHQETGSSFYANTFTLCGHLVRNDILVKINGENCHTELNGLYMPDREQHFDNTLYVDHHVGHSSSKQFYRGIMENNATAVFFGQSYINKDAIKSDIQQTNNNILLSQHSKIHSKPQLIIHNDDVSATHGSTVGQLDQEALFYMRSRGIGQKRAKVLLLNAFAEEVINKVQIEKLRLYYQFLVEKRLTGDKIEMQCTKLGECRGC
ncbi:MAG: Fe-S cluster assembly protein SufD [Bacteroidales bacterium]|nr:Fe-S cluster assembly protein SufD [Bacteroidales bacterium]